MAKKIDNWENNLKLRFPLYEERLYLLEALDDFEAVFGLLVLFEEFLGAFDGVFFLAEEVVDEMEILDIDGAEVAVAFFVLFGLKDVELSLPEAEEGLVDPEHLRDLAHSIVLFAEQDLVGGDIDQLGFGGYFFEGFAAALGWRLHRG